MFPGKGREAVDSQQFAQQKLLRRCTHKTFRLHSFHHSELHCLSLTTFNINAHSLMMFGYVYNNNRLVTKPLRTKKSLNVSHNVTFERPFILLFLFKSNTVPAKRKQTRQRYSRYSVLGNAVRKTKTSRKIQIKHSFSQKKAKRDRDISQSINAVRKTKAFFDIPRKNLLCLAL